MDDAADEETSIELDVLGRKAALLKMEYVASEIYGRRRAVAATLLVPYQSIKTGIS